MKYDLVIRQGYSDTGFTFYSLADCQSVIEALADKGDEQTEFKIIVLNELRGDVCEAEIRSER